MQDSNLRLNLVTPKPSLIFKLHKVAIQKVVGDARFELATPWTQTKCATKLR
jgi:hypothetical protein